MGVHVSEESWFSRIGGAFKGILVGGILCVIGVPVLFWNEGRAVRTAKGLKEGAKVVQNIEPDTIDSAMEGKFVHVSGMTQTDDMLRDDQFGIEYNGIRLVRHVETYQWKEREERERKKKLGGGTKTITTYTYSKVWEPGLIDSSKFDEASTHQNPTSVPFSARSEQAKQVHLGAFRLPESLISQINKPEPVQFTIDQLPTETRSMVSLGQRDGATMAYWSKKRSSDASVTPTSEPGNNTAAESSDQPEPIQKIDLEQVGTEQPVESETEVLSEETPAPQTLAATDISSDPQIGDTRVWFTATPASEISLLSSQRGESFQPYVTQTGTELHRLEMGSVNAEEMIQHAEHENMILTWILRGVGTVVLFVGFSLLMRPLVVLADVVPMFGSLVGFGTGLIAGLAAFAVSLTTIGIAWVFYRPLLGATLLAIAAACIFLIIRRGRNASRDREPVERMTEMDLV
ncbi:TMEM43 family protein [Stieleria varia]|uniref:Uncharacterized protein n=1 Tax=Stieleria varia TaxID=2528005 RepID=A0A5C5ZX07_9BACT|nr:TMEM43 family protein [Stieleria varia]TWT91769.1 hypothetical protein Pla52n_65190 [Stieleria varia]